MPKIIAKETKQEIKGLFNIDIELSLKAIAEMTGVSTTSVYKLTGPRVRYNKGLKPAKKPKKVKNRKKRFMVSYEQLNNWAMKNGYKDYCDYQLHIILGNDFESRTEYFRYLRRKKGFESGRAFWGQWAKDKGFDSIKDFKDYWAQQKGYDDIYDYKKEMNERRQGVVKNQNLSLLIRERLKELKKTQKWLAATTGISEECISKYSQAKYFPKTDRLKRLYSALEVPYQTVDDLLLK